MRSLWLGIALAALSMPALAAEKSLGAFGGWHAYSYSEGGQQVCYMVTTKLLKSTALKRGQPYLMVTHRPVEASRDVVSYGAGTTMESRRGVRLRTGGKEFDMFSVRDIAWARDPQTDHKIAALFQTAPSAQFTSYTPGKKKKLVTVTDTFDLAGGAGAYRAIGKACGYIHDAPKPAMPAKKPAKKSAKKR